MKILSLLHKRLLHILIIIGFGIIFINSGQTELTYKEIIEDIEQFQSEVEGRCAYFKTDIVDYRPALQKIREKAVSGMSKDQFGNELRKALSLFRDCHSAFRGFGFAPGNLPFIMEPVGRKYIAIEPDRSSFVDDSFPYISGIDGKSIDDWIEIISAHISKGSPQLIKVRALMYLGFIQFVREEAGYEKSDIISVELVSADGRKSKSVELDVTSKPIRFAPWPNSESYITENNIGYFRITNWTQKTLEDIKEWLPDFRRTRGLIIDLRDNTGGTRLVLRDLFPYFTKESNKPIVANAAKYKLYKTHSDAIVNQRTMYKQDWDGWDPAEKQAIDEFMKSFRPEWYPPENEFSDWHFWVMSKKTNPGVFYYSKLVVFLMNYRSFSASDVILSAVKGFGNITLMGLPSGGGSGAAQTTTLKNSKFRLRLSTMASFQSTGRLFDGVGVEPDIYIEPEHEYFLKGGRDKTLEKAVKFILDK